MQKFVISNDSTFSMVWMVIDTVACMASAYMYAFLACYGVNEDGPRDEEELLFEMLWEFVFLISIIKCFLTDYRVEGESFPKKNFFKIAQRYLKGDFMIDFIPIVPIPFMINLHTFPDGKLFYLLKIVRLKRGLEVFNVQAWIRGLKE